MKQQPADPKPNWHADDELIEWQDTVNNCRENFPVWEEAPVDGSNGAAQQLGADTIDWTKGDPKK